jgi:hypothetical protein
MLRRTAKIAAGVFVLIVLGYVVIWAALSAKVDKLSAQSVAEHTISQSEFDAIRPGELERTVESTLGSPDDSNSIPSQSSGAKSGQRCIYYGQRGGDSHSFQLCFDQSTGALEFKNRL